ncbi:hypothetical protein NOR_00427 [Metarhizium rileyi]|uniref:Clr5 domain-containing protein n=1 Tax=Metarhizium rileyi (strain RCEF 4871) TaxID=1649241 RepID=A0A167KK23_METRR|nr:hypothetical protein NOR_00427 [Metarhizium rileyi RCEF 4871]TWU77742.1 hypothetical protein ED733_008564 [Metarhizium rileyi]
MPQTPLPWEQHRLTIISLYAKHTLDEVVAIMERDYQFKANARTYQKKFDGWGIGKRFNSRSRPYALTSDGSCAPTKSHGEGSCDMTASVEQDASFSAYTQPDSQYPYPDVGSYFAQDVSYADEQGQYDYGMTVSDPGQFDVSQMLPSQIPQQHYPSNMGHQMDLTSSYISTLGPGPELQFPGQASMPNDVAYQQVGIWPEDPPPAESIQTQRSSSRRSNNRTSS